MAKTILTFLSLVFLFSCSSNRYLLVDENEDKFFLSKQIKEQRKKGLISSKPIIVIDGVPHRFDKELKENELKISKSEIKKIDIVKAEAATKVYGEDAQDGVILITTKEPKDNNASQVFGDSKVFVLLDGIEVSVEIMNSLDPNQIQSVTVLKSKEAIKKYTSEDYDGVILIEMKK